MILSDNHWQTQRAQDPSSEDVGETAVRLVDQTQIAGPEPQVSVAKLEEMVQTAVERSLNKVKVGGQHGSNKPGSSQQSRFVFKCYYCKREGHMARDCKKRAENASKRRSGGQDQSSASNTETKPENRSSPKE